MYQGMSIAVTRDEDEDSLFGSPPPSPGRPASPTLALPSSGYRGSSVATHLTQNVGTIALPGSHPDSELPINPLALSLNHGIVQRPPAPQPMATHSACTSVAGPSHSRSSSGSSSKPKKKAKTASRYEPPPKPTGPEFALPDPSAPPPVHFLRNQQNLLGKAGRIAGVKPAALTHIRGSTPSNPIVVDEEDDEPTIGRRAPSQEKPQPYIDPSLLTAPTNQEIVSVLIGQKDIFPILEGVLKLVMGSTPAMQPPTSVTGFERNTRPPSQPPAKKRKLNRVPAGATDWDVPYPFQQGEGPEAYHKNWERERGKRLISQLIKLIKSAARKAATKKYLQEQKEKEMRVAAEQKLQCTGQTTETKTINDHHRPETACGVDVLQDASNTPPMPRAESAQTPTPVETDPTMAAAFDQFMLSISNLPEQSPNNFNPSEGLATPGTASESASVDQPLFDTWMSLLETFPVNFDGTGTQSSTQCSTPVPEMSDFDFANMLGTGMANTDPSSSTADFDAMMSSMFQNQSQTDGGIVIPDANLTPAPPPPLGSHLIDPRILAPDLLKGGPSASLIPVGSAENQASSSTLYPINTTSAPVVPQAFSPMPSGSSLGDSTTPGTPASAGWEYSLPRVFGSGSGAISRGGSDSEGMWRSTMWGRDLMTYDGDTSSAWPGTGTSVGVDGSLIDFEMLPRAMQQPAEDKDSTPLGGSARAKGKGRMLNPPSAPMLVATGQPSLLLTLTTTPAAALVAPEPSAQPPQTTYGSFMSGKTGMESLQPRTVARQLRKEDIVRRAQEQRKALQKELDTAKVRLWGSTIEQAGLILLAKKLDVGKDQPGAGPGAVPQESTS